MKNHLGIHKCSCFALLLIIVCPFAMAATVRIPDDSAEVKLSGSLTISIHLTKAPGEQVAGGQWDLVFDPNIFELNSITTGAAATAAGKTVSFTVLEPGKIRMLVSGMNLIVIPDGVMAEVDFIISRATPDGDHPIDLAGLVLSNPYGVEVASVADAGIMTIVVQPLPAQTALAGLSLILAFIVVARRMYRRSIECV